MGSGRTRATGPGDDVAFQLVYGDRELALALPFEHHVEARLLQMLAQGCDEAATAGRKSPNLAREIVEAITALIENTTLPPSEKQVRYAIAIARELSLELPPEVLQFRPAMTAFLGAHASRYRRLRGQ